MSQTERVRQLFQSNGHHPAMGADLLLARVGSECQRASDEKEPTN